MRLLDMFGAPAWPSPSRDSAAVSDAAEDRGCGGAALRVCSISKRFGRFAALRDVSLEVTAGEIVGLFGEDGAGKTTLFEAIIGLVQLDGGCVQLNGADITALTIDRRAPLGLSYLSQEPSIFRGMTVAENVDAVLELRVADRQARSERLDWLLAEFNLAYIRDTPAPRLSGGERRRCEIARAMAASPSVMLLDEPFAGIDPLTVLSITEALGKLRRMGVGVLISDQNVDAMLTIIDRAYVLHQGTVVFSGSPQAMLGDEGVRRCYLGEEFHSVQ